MLPSGASPSASQVALERKRCSRPAPTAPTAPPAPQAPEPASDLAMPTTSPSPGAGGTSLWGLVRAGVGWWRGGTSTQDTAPASPAAAPAVAVRADDLASMAVPWDDVECGGAQSGEVELGEEKRPERRTRRPSRRFSIDPPAPNVRAEARALRCAALTKHVAASCAALCRRARSRSGGRRSPRRWLCRPSAEQSRWCRRRSPCPLRCANPRSRCDTAHIILSQ